MKSLLSAASCSFWGLVKITKSFHYFSSLLCFLRAVNVERKKGKCHKPKFEFFPPFYYLKLICHPSSITFSPMSLPKSPYSLDPSETSVNSLVTILCSVCVCGGENETTQNFFLLFYCFSLKIYVFLYFNGGILEQKVSSSRVFGVGDCELENLRD